LFYVSKKYFGRSGITIGCPNCDGRSKKNGLHRSGKQRYRCVVCKHSFVRQSHSKVGFKQFIQFYQFIAGKVNRDWLLKLNSQSRKTLSVRFKLFFSQPLLCDEVWEILPPDLSSPWTYGVDGKYLKRQGVFIIHRNITTKENLYWSFHSNETYLALHSDLVRLTELIGEKKNYPQGAISDWKGAIVSGVASHLGDIPHQRCLTHVVAQAKKLLPKRSPFLDTLILRSIALELIHLRTQKELADWFERLAKWHDRYGYLLKQRTIGKGTKKKWWYTHSNLRRAWRLLTSEPEPFFKHLSCPLLPHSNNSLEGTISQAVNKLINHRGMKLRQQISFLRWYFTFSRVRNKQDLRKLWGYWKGRL